MKHVLIAALAAFSLPTFAADVGVSINVGEPGFYGQIDIGNYPPPRLIYAQPVVVQPAPAYGPPIYLHVPPGHAKHWRKHCMEYNACGRQVYFVQDSWYNQVYVPRYRQEHGGDDHWRDHDDHGHGHGHGHDHDHGHGHDRD